MKPPLPLQNVSRVLAYVCVWERDTRARLGVDDPQVATVVRTGVLVPLAAERVHPVTRGRKRRKSVLAVLFLFDPGWGLDGDQEGMPAEQR